MTGAALRMSTEAVHWALRNAPGVPSQCVGVLIGLAEHADRRGRGAYPSAATLSHYARKSERQARTDLETLAAAGVIRPGDQSLAAHLPSNRRPVVYDLAVERVSDVQSTAPRSKPRGSHDRSRGMQSTAPQDSAGMQSTAGEQSTAPQSATDLQEPAGMQSTAPQDAEVLGCSPAQPGVQSTAYKPPENLKSKPSLRRRRDLNAGREDALRLCAHLADRIEANLGERPQIGKKWLDAARLLLDNDKRTEAQVHRAIDWCQDSEFWHGNILSMPTLREKYLQLQAQASPRRQPAPGGSNGSRPSTTDQRVAQAQALKTRFRQEPDSGQPPGTIAGSVLQ